MTGTELINRYNNGERDFREADLREADLSGANLRGTCLDPQATIPPITDDKIIAAGLEIRGGYVYGWRTATSQHSGSQTYEPGRIYMAPWFSVAETPCHPGLYLAGRAWLECNGYGTPYVRVRCQRADLHRAGDKWRARAVEVRSS